MKKTFLLLLLLFQTVVFAQEFSVLTWNIANLGKSKSDAELTKIAEIISQADIVAIQEVVSSYHGAQAVSKILAKLNKKNNIWDYSLSNVTQSTGNRAERYVFFWKKNKCKIKRKFELESIYANPIEREPYIGSFTIGSKEVKIFNFHALPKKHNPEQEIKFFKNYKNLYGAYCIYVGDFNVHPNNSVFNPIKFQGYEHVLPNQKTTLKQECKEDNCLANAYDYIWYPTQTIKLINAYPILFYQDFETLKQARHLSDHIPLVAKFSFIP